MVFQGIAPALFLALGTLLGFGAPARADDCAQCERFADFIPQYSLAANVAAIGTAALHPEGHVFHVDAEVADALRRQIDADLRIPASCRSYVKGLIHVGPQFSVTTTGTVGGNADRFLMDNQSPSNLMGAYGAQLSTYYSCARPGDGATATDQANYVSCLQQNGSASYQRFSHRLQSGTDAQLIAAFGANGITVTASDLAVLKEYDKALNSGNEAGLLAWAAQAGRRLSTDQFLTVVQMLGSALNTSYNHPRANSVGNAGNGIITVTDALQSIRNNTQYLITGDQDPAASLGQFEVVCRDAAVVQARVLRAGGFPNSYIVSYRSVADGHSDIITQDPHNPLRLYTINWDGRATHNGLDGSRALFQGSGSGIPDYSLAYQVSSPDGQTVARIPSEMGKFLTEAAGGDIRVWDPLARATSSMVAITMSPDHSGNVQIRGIYGSDGNGAQYFGMGASATWGAGTHLPGEVGIFAGEQFRPGPVYQGTENGGALLGYGQLTQHVVSSPVPVAPHTTATLDAHLTAAGNISLVTSGPDLDVSTNPQNFNSGHNERLGAEVRVENTALNGRLHTQAVVGGSLTLGATDIRNDTASSATVTPVNLYAGVSATLDVGPARLFAQSTLVASQLGVRNRTDVGVATRTVAASAFVAGRVTDGSALIEDNSIRRAGLSLTWTPNRYLRFNATGEMPIEGDDPVHDMRLTGNAALLFP